jgi:hypothetical protein
MTNALTEAEYQEPHRVAARLRLANAMGFLKAGDSLLAQHKASGDADDMFHIAAFFVNLCFAYELSLKGFLAYRKWGGDEKNDLGHDLKKTLGEAVELGYQPPARVIETIDILGPLSKSHELRYLRPGLSGINLPDPPDRALVVAQAHLRAIGDQIPIADIQK